MIRVAMLSKWHVHAPGYARQINSTGKAVVAAVWDEIPERGKAWADEMGVPFEECLDTLLARQGIDAVAICTPTSMHKEVMVKAANAGKHIFTEKAMALTVKDCEEIAAAVRANNVKFCISYPHLTEPVFQYCKQALEAGWLGEIHYMRFRNAHDGTFRGWLPDYWYDPKTAGGGAMMDLGCHPVYTAAYLLGKPERITSVFTNQHSPTTVDDNAVCVVEFKNHAIAVLETSFISPKDAGCFELLGTKGGITRLGKKVLEWCPERGIDDWKEVENLPERLQEPIFDWVDALAEGKEIRYGLEMGIMLTELLENAYISDAEQRIVKI